MSPDTFIEGVRDLLHERAKAGDEAVAFDLGNLLRQVEMVFEGATVPGEETPEDLRKAIESLQEELEEAEKDRDRAWAKVKELTVKVERYGDDPDTGRAEEVGLLRDLMRDSAGVFADLASDLAAPRVRKERIIGLMRAQVAQMQAEVGEGEGDE